MLREKHKATACKGYTLTFLWPLDPCFPVRDKFPSLHCIWTTVFNNPSTDLQTYPIPYKKINLLNVSLPSFCNSDTAQKFFLLISKLLSTTHDILYFLHHKNVKSSFLIYSHFNCDFKTSIPYSFKHLHPQQIS